MSTATDSSGEVSNDVWDDLTVRVYYEDTDAQGVVYFANYLRFMERGRTEWLRSRGVEQDALRREQNLCFSLVRTEADFRQPARFDDELTVRTQVSEVSGARVRFRQAVHRAADQSLLCSADCVVACVAADTFRPRRVPRSLFGSGA